jgi:hypothetical protein
VAPDEIRVSEAAPTDRLSVAQRDTGNANGFPNTKSLEKRNRPGRRDSRKRRDRRALGNFVCDQVDLHELS